MHHFGYLAGMIRSFADRETEALWARERVKGIDGRIQRPALRKLAMLNAAAPDVAIAEYHRRQH